MHLSNEADSPLGEHPGEHNQRLKDWILSEYRKDYPVGSRKENHLSTCPEVEVTFDFYDSYCNDDACFCERAVVEAELECRHGVRRSFQDWYTDSVAEVVHRLEIEERHVLEQRSKQVIRVGALEPGPGVTPMVVIYHDTLDYPGLYVARQHDIGPGVVAVHPSPLVVSTSLREVRGVVPEGMIRISPLKGDDPKILEVYV